MTDQRRYLLETNVEDIMVPANKVAFVNEENALEHALLILTQSGYSAIPVLDHASHVKGIINTTLIVKAIIGINGYDTQKLGETRIREVMMTDIPRVNAAQTLRRAFELSINWPFLCVEDVNGKFVGILTRKNILAALYQFTRQLGLHEYT